MTNYVLIGIGKTDENGVAHLDTDANGNPLTHSYTGVGAGELDVVASLDNPIIDDSIVSEPCNVFDCPVYDGDNTPVSINFSKTNKAVVTDEVVSLIASVLNTNNNPCINIPVVFKRGNTVLGTAYTDCTGDATITQVWEDSDIFDVTATVGENLSEDITMFVKDKNNLLNFNQWSCGEYLNNLTGLTKNNNNVSITPETSSIGDKCLKLIPLSDKNYTMGVELSFANEDIGKTITASADIKNSASNCRFQLRNGSDTNSVLINLPDSDWANYTVSSEITETIMIVYVFARSDIGEIFLDNLKVTIS